MKLDAVRSLSALRRQSNDEIDALAAVVFERAVVVESAADIAKAYAAGKIVVCRTDGVVRVQTADERWSPTRDIAVAARLEGIIRRRRLQRRYVTLLIEMIQAPSTAQVSSGETAQSAEAAPAAASTAPPPVPQVAGSTAPTASDQGTLFELISATARQRTLAAILAASEETAARGSASGSERINAAPASLRSAP
jgi:hypothetical protein